MDEQQMQDLLTAVCTADPQLGAEWYELLGKETPSAESSEWADLLQRIHEVAGSAGVPVDGLLEHMIETDARELQARIAWLVWPDSAGTTDAAEVGLYGDGESHASETEEDVDAWNAFLAENGPAWDGTADNWPAFVEWFVYTADEHRVGTYARQFCDYVAASDDPLTVFAQYGIILPTGYVDHEQNDLLLDRADSVDPVSADEFLSQHSATVLSALQEQYPDLVVDEAELSRVLAEVLAAREGASA